MAYLSVKSVFEHRPVQSR